jgi:hypothetical protein
MNAPALTIFVLAAAAFFVVRLSVFLRRVRTERGNRR